MGEVSPAFGTCAAGSQIAGYLLEEQIGRGGMAVVFRAHDERLDRRVALKVLAPELAADEAFRQRFIRESRAAAAVDDPHIIPVFEAGEAEGQLFIAMRYIRGGDVRSLGRLTANQVAEVVSQVASALDAAHRAGLVRRDVKPANMLMDSSPDGNRPDHVYLSDFGLSKATLNAPRWSREWTTLVLFLAIPMLIIGSGISELLGSFGRAVGAILIGVAVFAVPASLITMLIRRRNGRQ